MTEVPQELAIFCKFDDAVARRRSGDPDILVTIDTDGLQPARPSGNVILTSPGPNNAAVGVEFHDFRSHDAAFGAWRRGRRAELIRPRVGTPIDTPDRKS